jgi:prophage tail gpP-like protein
MSTLTLSVGGHRLEGWLQVEISRGIEQLAGIFEIRCADRWALRGQPLPELKNQACEVLIDGEVVIRGHVDGAAPTYSARGHELVVRGRDATGDLVDVSATTDGEGWVGRSLTQIAEDLCSPLGIAVSIDAAVAADAGEPFRYQQLQIGETCHAALARLARLRGCLLISDGLGGLQITRAGTGRAATPLVLGRNVLAATAEDSCADRFRTYRVLGQDREDDRNADTAQQIRAEATDLGARAGRLLIIDPVDPCNAADARRLAEWTSAMRAAQAQRVRYTVRGWLDGAKPWQPNQRVVVQDPWARFDGEYLLAGITHRLSDAGEITQLDVVPPKAYELIKQREVDPDA